MKIIYISGIDGCGKTTQATKLVKWLQSQGHSAEYQWLRWEPSIVPAINKFRTLLGKKSVTPRDKNTIDTAAENADHAKWGKLKSALFSSALFRWLWIHYATNDYYRAYKKVHKSWASDYVIMDRYIIDFIIDQSLNFGIDVATFIDNTKETAIHKMESASLSVLIDIPAEVGYQRKLDGTPLAYLQDRRNRYLSVPESERLLRLDGTNDIDEIQNSIRQWVTNHLKETA